MMDRQRHLTPYDSVNAWIAGERPALAFEGASREDWERWRPAFEARLRELLGPLAEPVDLAPEVTERVDCGEYVRERVVFDSEKYCSVAAYVLVPQGEIDDAVLKEAIAQGRMYGAFDYLGYPVGFDFHALLGETVYEMGDHAPADTQVDLIVTLPKVHRLHPLGEQPTISARILKADDGEWVEIATGMENLRESVGAGAYRAEIRIVPEHLRPWLGPEADDYMMDYPWIYSNPIYVGMDYAR